MFRFVCRNLCEVVWNQADTW